MNEHDRDAPISDAWILAALLPALCHVSGSGALAWAAALIVGAFIAEGRLLRWVAIAWAALTATPATPVVATVAAGSMAGKWTVCLRIAALGLLFALFWPLPLRNSGMLLLVAGTVLAVRRRTK